MIELIGAIIQIGLMYHVAADTINIRNHSIVGWSFLKHARSIFKETGHSHEVGVLDDIAMPHLHDIRYEVASRLFWLTICMLVAIVMLGAVLFELAEIGHMPMALRVVGLVCLTYTIYAYIKNQIAKSAVDEVCDACDEDLIEIGRPDEYQVMLNGYMVDDMPKPS